MIVDAYYRSSAWTPTFAELLRQLKDELQPMSETVQTPRWLPDADSGTHWFVRPLSTMATNSATADRYTAIDTEAPGYDAGDSGTWTTFFNHPLAANRNINPIDPASVVTVGYPNKTWTGSPTTMATEVLLDTTTLPGTRFNYISSSNGPGFVDPVDSEFKGTATVNWTYADMAVLDGTTYAKAWPGLSAIQWAEINPGDTLWICGTHEEQTLTVGASGTAGNYIKIRFDYPGDSGTINKAGIITGSWTASGDEYWIDYPEISEAMMFEDGARLIGINSRSRCRTQVQHASINFTNNSFSFSNIRRVQTGDPIDIADDFQWEQTLPLEYTGGTRYYAIIDNCDRWVGTVGGVGGTPGTWQFYTVGAANYTARLATSYANAMAGTAIDITAIRNPAYYQQFFLIYVTQTTAPFYDQQPGSLEPGEYVVDVVQGRLYYRPTTGVPGDHVLRLAADTFAAGGACIYGINRSYIKILGGGEYGGLFADTPAPLGRVGLSHMNAIEFDTCSHIVIDGMHIEGTRSAAAFLDTDFGTVRNCRIAHCAHHGSGGEDLAGTQEPDQLLERNWFSDIGQGHDFSDAQALVTNPECDRTIFRRNFCERIGRNEKASNPAVVVYDSSDDVITFLNWFDDCHGKAVEMDGGTALVLGVTESGTSNGVIAANICTRQGQGLDPALNTTQRVGFVHLNLNGQTDRGIDGTQIFGNIVAFCTIGNVAPDANDECGVIYQRTNNNTGFYNPPTNSLPSANEISLCTQNAFLQIEDGPVFSMQKNTNASAAPWPTLVSDRNLYASVSEFGLKTTSGTLVDSWSVAEFADWQADTGRDALSIIRSRDESETRNAAPTTDELEILRLYDEYDTYDPPTLSMVGAFPFSGGT